jgi:hypothetical protein
VNVLQKTYTPGKSTHPSVEEAHMPVSATSEIDVTYKKSEGGDLTATL